jgi:hypothetical protein
MNQPIDRKHMTKLTVEEFHRLFRNKKDHLHEQVMKCGFYLPK